MTLSVTNKILGWVFKPLGVTVVADQVGPTLVCLKFRSLFGSGIWVETVVPEEPMFLRITNYIFADWWIPTFIATSTLKVSCFPVCLLESDASTAVARCGNVRHHVMTFYFLQVHLTLSVHGLAYYTSCIASIQYM